MILAELDLVIGIREKVQYLFGCENTYLGKVLTDEVDRARKLKANFQELVGM